jgi:hypothetical protein
MTGKLQPRHRCKLAMFWGELLNGYIVVKLSPVKVEEDDA